MSNSLHCGQTIKVPLCSESYQNIWIIKSVRCTLFMELFADDGRSDIVC